MSKREITISLPELGLVAGTRGIIGAGIGLLLADRLNFAQRKAVGWTLFAVGALISIPIGFEVLGGKRVRLSGDTTGVTKDMRSVA